MEPYSRPMCGSRRQNVSRMTVACLGISGITLLLQIVSVATDYWATYSMADIGGAGVHLGLWKVCSCFSGICACMGIPREHLALYHFVLAGAIPVFLLTIVLNVIELFYESRESRRVVKFVLSLVSATCLFVGVGLFAADYENTLANYDDILTGKLKLGWSFILCAVTCAAMTVVAIIHFVDICRKRRSGPGLSIRYGDTMAIVPQDALSMEAGSVPLAYTSEVPGGQVVSFAGTQ